MEGKRTVKVTVNSMQSSGDVMPPYETQTMAIGELEQRGTGYILSYEEAISDDAMQTEKTRVKLHISEHRVMMMREGIYSTMMVFDRRQPYEGMYRTPFGTMPIHIQTVEVDAVCRPEKGKIRMEYELTLADTSTSDRVVNIHYFQDEMQVSLDEELPE